MQTRATQLVAIIILIGYFGLIGALLKWGIPAVNSEPIWILVGGLASAFGAVVQFFFGSSTGSVAKTDMLEKQLTGKWPVQVPHPNGAIPTPAP